MSETLTAPAAERAPRVPVAASPLAVLVVLVALLLPGCDRGKVEKLEVENTKLKSELEKVQQQVKEPLAKQKQDAIDREQAEAVRKQEVEQTGLKEKQEAEKQQQAKTAEAISKCLQKILLRMDALKDESRDFTLTSKTSHEAMESRLKTLANSKKEEMGESLIELRSLGYAETYELDRTISAFVDNYGWMVSYSRLGNDAIEKEDRDRFFASEMNYRNKMQAAELAVLQMWEKAKTLHPKQ